MSSYPALEKGPSSDKWGLILFVVLALVVGLVQLLNKIQTSIERRFGSNRDKDEKKDKTVQTPEPKDQRPLPDLNVAIKDLRLAVRAHGAKAEVAIKLE
ncbi:hypothetical protein LTR24_002209 [Lithohypha guttulata]|uniref:Uncharacterized protein n=1 Tax=Lithohypha guttulata TaxID=1690604 RepID=A0ABR0KIA7_9EURO|nr:hypothetical protein LTR24_002209 [Lithohypha guttulata]